MLAKDKQTWRFVVPTPPREVFATMEQLIGTLPYRFEVIDKDTAQAIEVSRRGVFGNWVTPRAGVRWVRCTAIPTAQGTEVTVTASSPGGMLLKATGRLDNGPVARALQLVRLLTSGRDDYRTIYRRRLIPPGAVTLVASWAGTPYRLYAEPRYDAEPGPEIHTATELEAVPGGDATFVKVRLRDGREGYVERDQIVAATEVATREAQTEVARFV
ncbi:MAG: hypothetical protein JOZ75_11675 [Candidatus Dormibacteraeota bacterium]|nr:hypothetical protein [Candidatus Dormibacteraeota bacterium]